MLNSSEVREHHTHLCRRAPVRPGVSSLERPAEFPLQREDEWFTPPGPPAPFMVAECPDLILRGSRGETVRPIAHQRPQRRLRDERVVSPRHSRSSPMETW